MTPILPMTLGQHIRESYMIGQKPPSFLVSAPCTYLESKIAYLYGNNQNVAADELAHVCI